MLSLTRITNPENPMFRELTPLYTKAFPPSERRDPRRLGELLQREPSMFFHALQTENAVAGFLIYWNFHAFSYLEHLAVHTNMRNRKIGQQVLDWVAQHLPGLRLLEVEPAHTKIAARRIGYYRRNGYHVLDKTYLQPPYRPGEITRPLWIMGNKKSLPPHVLKNHMRLIKTRVYRFPPSDPLPTPPISRRLPSSLTPPASPLPPR